jgi:hypothetical protein
MSAASLPARAVPTVRALLAGKGRLRALLAAYGVAVAVVGVAQWGHDLNPGAMTIMGGRSNNVASSIAVLDAGGPPLIASAKPYGEPWPKTPGQAYFQVGAGDDLGSYVYLPLLGHWFGTTSPTHALKWLFLGCFGILLALYPLLFYELLGSVAAAIVAPLLVLWRFGFVKDTDIYWVTAWFVLLCVPALVLLAHRRWRKRSVAALAAVLVFASFASSIRSQAGLGVFASGIVLALLREPTWRRRIVVVLIAIAAYGSVKPALIWGVDRYRDHVLSAYVHTNPNYGQNFPSGHPFWHPAYLGLGYLPNRWGIAWNDTIAFDAAERARPGVPYLSREYENTLRSLYLKLVEHHPGFALRTYWAKSLVVIHQALTRFLWGLILLVVLGLVAPLRRLLRRGVLIALPSLAVTFAPPVMTIPAPQYALGWVGSIGLLWILAVTATVSLAARWAASVGAYVRSHSVPPPAEAGAQLRGLHVATLVRQRVWAPVRSQRVALALAAAGVVALAGISSGVSGAARMDFYREVWTPVVPGTAIPGSVVAHWGLASAVGHTWTAQTPGVSTTLTGSSVSVLTAPNNVSPTLASPPVALKPGTYKLLLRGRVDSGGLIAEAQDAANGGLLLAQTAYYWQQPGFDNGSMVTGFVLNKPTKVRFLLLNWTDDGAPSHWTLDEAALVQTAAPAPAPSLRGQNAKQNANRSSRRGFYASGASPLVVGAAAGGPFVRSWSFAEGLPQMWRPGNGATRVARTTGGVSVETDSAVQATALIGPALTAGPGIVRILVKGAVTQGGLGIGAVDVSTGTFIANSTYWSHERGFASKTMSVPFQLPLRTRLRVVLWNWTDVPRPSSWTIRSIALATGLGK